jgi:5-formyltetrahydrofolate cyclo-ligase
MAVPSPSPAAKSDVRAEMLARRRAFVAGLTPARRAGLEAALAGHVLPLLPDIGIVAAYCAMDDEIGVDPILAGLRAGQRAAFPWFAARGADMIWREGPARERGQLGILQPAASAAELDPDLVLVPLVAVDRHGTRIGFGKGHYDKALAARRAKGPVATIGICWDVQLSETPLPADPWDFPLDAVATPSGLIRCA